MIPQNSMRVYLALGSTDMRKAINGLSVLVEQALGLNPFCGDLFVFCNRRRNIIKILYWDENGFALWYKRLEEHRFKWPKLPEQVLTINRKQLSWLLAGLDFSTAHQRLYYKHAG
jgi:transposase